MPRRGNIAKRDVLPDPVYSNKVVTKLINQVMLDGKKGIAQGIVYEALKALFYCDCNARKLCTRLFNKLSARRSSTADRQKIVDN